MKKYITILAVLSIGLFSLATDLNEFRTLNKTISQKEQINNEIKYELEKIGISKQNQEGVLKNIVFTEDNKNVLKITKFQNLF